MTQLSGKWLQDNAVSSNKILDGAVNAAKIDSTDSYTMQSISTTADTTVGGTLKVLGDSTTDGNLSILGDGTIAGGLNVLGDFSIASLSIPSLTTPQISGDSTLSISGDTTVDGNFSVLGDSSVTGGFYINTLSLGSMQTISFNATLAENELAYLLEVPIVAPNTYVFILGFVNIITTLSTNTGYAATVYFKTSNVFTGVLAITSIGYNDSTIYAPSDYGASSSRLCIWCDRGNTGTPARINFISRHSSSPVNIYGQITYSAKYL